MRAELYPETGAGKSGGNQDSEDTGAKWDGKMEGEVSQAQSRREIGELEHFPLVDTQHV